MPKSFFVLDRQIRNLKGDASNPVRKKVGRTERERERKGMDTNLGS